LSTIQGADEIVVLEDGEVIERGSHDELITKGGTYQRFVEKQALDQEGPEPRPSSVTIARPCFAETGRHWVKPRSPPWARLP